MSIVLFTAVERFDPSSDAWTKFVAWSRLPQLREVVSLDESLCPGYFRQLTADDWQHNVHVDFRTHLFRNVDHVIARTADVPVNVLALIEEPSSDDVRSFSDPRFVFCGFDLIEDGGGTSALTNCGGFEKSFARSELSEHGLLLGYERARTVQKALRDDYPEESHANCRLWAIWRLRREP